MLNVRPFTFILLSLLFPLALLAQEPQIEEEPASIDGEKTRYSLHVDAGVPVMLSNQAQRVAFRGLISLDLGFRFRLGNRKAAKNMYLGFAPKYSVFQSRTPNGIVLKNRDLLLHQMGFNLHFGYEAATQSKRVIIYPSLNLGYHFALYTNLLQGLEPLPQNPRSYLLQSGFGVSPNFSVMLFADEEKSTAIGFNLGASLILYNFSKSSVYINEQIESGTAELKDNGPTVLMNIGFTFLQKFGKIRIRNNNIP
jgi:hypothetical protein